MTNVDRLCRMGTIPATATPGPYPAIQPARTIAPCSCARLRRRIERANDGDVRFKRWAVWVSAAPYALRLRQLHPQPARRLDCEEAPQDDPSVCDEINVVSMDSAS